MLTDDQYEKLRLAARAANYTYGVIFSIPRIKVDEGWTPWNPYEEPAQALELAVDLGIDIFHFKFRDTVEVWHPTDDINYEITYTDGNALQATCASIIEVAAELGKLSGDGHRLARCRKDNDEQ